MLYASTVSTEDSIPHRVPTVKAVSHMRYAVRAMGSCSSYSCGNTLYGDGVGHQSLASTQRYSRTLEALASNAVDYNPLTHT